MKGYCVVNDTMLSPIRFISVLEVKLFEMAVFSRDIKLSAKIVSIIGKSRRDALFSIYRISI